MNESIIDRTYVCLKLIDMLYKKGLVNEATYLNVKQTYPQKLTLFRQVVKDISPASVSLLILLFSGILALSEQIRSHKGGRCYVQYVSVLIVPFFPGQTLPGSYIWPCLNRTRGPGQSPSESDAMV